MNMLRTIMGGPTISIGSGTCQIWHSKSNYIAIGERFMCMFSEVRCKSRVRLEHNGRVSYRFDCVILREYSQKEVTRYMKMILHAKNPD